MSHFALPKSRRTANPLRENSSIARAEFCWQEGNSGGTMARFA